MLFSLLRTSKDFTQSWARGWRTILRGTGVEDVD